MQTFRARAIKTCICARLHCENCMLPFSRKHLSQLHSLLWFQEEKWTL